MKKILFFLAIAMLGIAGCSKPDNPGDEPEKVTISFTLSSAFVPSLPANYIIDEHRITVIIETPGSSYGTGFSIPAPGGTRTFTGDTARLWLGKDIRVGVVAKVYKPGNPYLDWSTTPHTPIRTKIEKTNVYNFTTTVGK